MPPVPDLYELGDRRPACVLMWGANTPVIGSVHGVCGKLVHDAIRSAEKLIVVDPRRTRSAEKADHWMQLRPGTDCALALAMIHVIITEDLVDHEFVTRYTTGYQQLTEHIRDFSPEWAEPITRVEAQHIRASGRAYATTKPACIHWGSAIDMSACAFQTARALLILRAITGNIDRPGGDVFWVPPNGVRLKSPFLNSEMSGRLLLPFRKAARAVDREKKASWITNGLLSLIDAVKKNRYQKFAAMAAKKPVGAQLKTLQKIKNSKYPLSLMVHPPTFWQSIINDDPYRVRALWIMGSNPLVTMTDPLSIEKALRQLDYLVVSDMFLTPTAQLADLVLPASTWLEQNDVVNYLKQWCVVARKKVAQVGEARDDREVMIELAGRLGLQGFPWANWAEFLEETLEGTGLSFSEFCERDILVGEMRYQKYETEGFNTPSGKVELASNLLHTMGVSPLPVYREPPLTPHSAPDVAREFPLILTTGARVVEYFHSEGRQIESLRRRVPDPLIDVHPATAESLGLTEGSWAFVESPHGRVRMKVRFFDGLAQDVVSAQHGWWFPEAEAPEHGWKKSNINLLFGQMECDTDTGSESLRSTLCRVSSA